MLKALPLLLLLVVSVPAIAIVDVHEEYYSNLSESAFSTFSFNLDGARGTKDEDELHIENHSMLRQEKSTWMFIGSYNFGETNEERSEDNLFAHIRYVRKLTGKHGFDVLAQYQKDEFALIDSRTVLGGGYRYEWQPGSEQRGLLGAGVIRVRERFVGGAEDDLWRGNLYLTVGQPVRAIPNGWLTFSAYAQPALESLDDVRAIAIFGISSSLTENLGVEFSIDFAHDSDPEAGFASTEWSYSMGIEWTFK